MNVSNRFEWRRLRDKHRGKLYVAQAIAFVLIGVLVAGMLWRTPSAPRRPADVDSVEVSTMEGETLWTCSMHPQIRQSKPGKCPICGMDLIPVAKSGGGMRTLALSPESKALMRIETSVVERRYVMHEIRMVGRVDYDETRLGYITAWVSGRLDRLFVDFTGVEVKKGDHLVSIYSEQLYSAQEELIQALRYRRERPSTTTTLIRPIDLSESAREKLRLLGLKEEQIAEIETQNQPSDHLTIYSPLGGIVIEKLKQQGERVQVGERIYTIADLGQLWVHLDAYESDLPWVRYGQDVTITTEAYPGEEFHGRIAFIQPVLNDKTRTVKVRVNVPNPDGKLKPEMFVHAVVRPQVAAGGKVMDAALAGKWICPMHPDVVKDEAGVCDICGMQLVQTETLGYVASGTETEQPPLVIPYSAALVTGTRAIVYVQSPDLPSFAESALQTLTSVVQQNELEKSREAFAKYGEMLSRPYDQPGTDFAKDRWREYAARLFEHAQAGRAATSNTQATNAYAEIDAVMKEVHEVFAPPDKPTFNGLEIVLGPRAGDYYLVRHGLHEGELVATQGAFKIDAEIQIQAKPSMMTPEGGGGGGHQHGGESGAAAQSSSGQRAGHAVPPPAEFVQQVHALYAVFQLVAESLDAENGNASRLAFTRFGEAVSAIDDSMLSDHQRMQWKELAMLLGNDAIEGADAQQTEEVRRVFDVMQGHMIRLRDQLGASSMESALPEPAQSHQDHAGH